MPHSLDMPAKNTTKNVAVRDLKTMSADELSGFAFSVTRTWLSAQRKDPNSETTKIYWTVLENIDAERMSRAIAA